MTELHGVVGSPYKTPQTRRKIPAPFQRPVIEVGGDRVRRTWKDTPVVSLKPGDVVAEVGQVASVEEKVIRPTGTSGQMIMWRVLLTNVAGITRAYNGHDRVFAFSEDTNE